MLKKAVHAKSFLHEANELGSTRVVISRVLIELEKSGKVKLTRGVNLIMYVLLKSLNQCQSEQFHLTSQLYLLNIRRF